MKRIFLSVAALAVMATAALPASAGEVDVRLMKLGTSGQKMVFEPAMIQVNVGDTVHFIPADPALNVTSILAMLPIGATAVKGTAGEQVSVTFTVPGAYGFKSSSGYVKGMVGLVMVGSVDPQSVDTARNPRVARERFDEMLSSLQ